MQTFNYPIHKDRRQYLRRNMPEPERILWNCLRNKKFNGHKFRRQHGIGVYIVDFYCPELKLVIEIDGDSHYRKEAIQYDNNRSEYFTKLNISTMRFTNLEIISNIEGVLLKLESDLNSRRTSPVPPPAPPLKGGGPSTPPSPNHSLEKRGDQ